MNKLTLKYLKTYRLNHLNTSFTMADPLRGGTHFRWLTSKAVTVAFTMAEILLSLTIIGVVAAITLPSLTGNINERTWNTQRKALYARMSQAIALMPNLNGYGIGATESETTANAAQIFISNGLNKVLKINNICDNTHLEDCGLPNKYKNTAGQTKSFPKSLKDLNLFLAYSDSTSNPNDPNAHDSYSLQDINTAAFETANGESIAVFYQPYCRNFTTSTSVAYIAPYMCANFIYDLNGKKGPNAVGKDIGFITAFYPTDSYVVMPIPLSQDSPDEDGSYSPSDYNKAKRACRLQGNDVRLPHREEIAAISVNSNLFALNLYYLSGSSTYATATSDWKIIPNSGLWTRLGYGAYKVRCIKR